MRTLRPTRAVADAADHEARSFEQSRLSRGGDLGLLGALACTLIGVAIGAQRLGDNSFLTHLATGRETLENGFVREDVFTWTSVGEPLVVQSWLASLLYGLVDEIAGLAGLRLLMAATAGALAALAWYLTERSPSLLTRVAVMVPVLYVGLRTWTERPLLIALVLFAVTLLLAERGWPSRGLVVVGALWISVHGSWPLGFVLLGTRAVGAWLDGDRDAARREARAGAWLGAGVALAGVINPYGPKLLLFPLELLGRRDTLQLVAEWQSPDFSSTWARAFLLLIAALVISAARRSSWKLTIPALTFVAAALLSRRNIPVAVLVMLPALAHGLPALGRLDARRTSPAIGMAAAALAALVIAVPLLGARRPHVDIGRYPVAAVDALEDAALIPGDVRIVHEDYVGNYLDVRFREPVAWIDDRFELHSAALVADYVTLLGATAGWSEVLDRWQAEVLLWPAEAPLAELVAGDGWSELYSDDAWVVLCHPTFGGC